MTAVARLQSQPLFLRIVAVLLGTVLVVQLANAVLLVLLPPPAPRFYPVEQIVHALQGEESAEFIAVRRPEPSIRQGDSVRERLLQDDLTRRVGAPVDDLRIALPRRFLPFRLPHLGAPPRRPTNVIPGGFAIARRLPGGQWLELRQAKQDGAFWRWQTFAWLVAALAVAGPLGWFLSRRIARPIAVFGRAAERLARNPRALLLPVEGPPEVREAAEAFNTMQARLQRYISDRALMLGAIAHDLRTPLMRVALHVEHAPDAVRRAVEAEVAEMQSMLNAVLAFLRDLEQPSERRRLDLRAAVQSVADGIADQGGKVLMEDGAAIVIDGDLAMLKAMAANLIRNGVVHGGSAAVTLTCDEHAVTLDVVDAGPGIPTDMLDRVFAPFERLERSRNRQSGGMGLGLASARAVARGHGGDVTLTNRADGGLLARAWLPR